MRKQLLLSTIGLGLVLLTVSCSKKDIAVSSNKIGKVVSMEKHADIKNNWSFVDSKPVNVPNTEEVSTTELNSNVCNVNNDVVLNSNMNHLINVVNNASQLKSTTSLEERKELYQLIKKTKKNSTQENIDFAKNGIKEKAVSDNTLLLVIVALFIPPLAVYLLNDSITDQFWIDLILSLLFLVPGIVYALYLILS